MPTPVPPMPLLSSSMVLTLAKSAEQIEVGGEICLYIPWIPIPLIWLADQVSP